MAYAGLATPKAPPDLGIPQSDAVVRVSCIDSTTRLTLDVASFLDPEYHGMKYMTIPAFGFLIEHATKKVLFDLGVRKKWQTLAPSIIAGIEKHNWKVDVTCDIADILISHGVNVADSAISEVIWSHHHWDHIGDISTFPPSTKLVVGPGFQAEFLPGYPENPEAPLHTSDLSSRPVREVDIARESNGLKIGRFAAVDYFGDGSFYLLDTPGHSVGHMCGLARTTPDTFVFMGGDACHHGGEFRPTPYLPLPKQISPWPRPGGVCPGHLLQDVHRHKSAMDPFFGASEKSAHDLGQCEWTIDGLGEFDARDNVFVLIAHDSSVLDDLTLFPEALNDWHERGLAKKVKWKFLEDFAEAVNLD